MQLLAVTSIGELFEYNESIGLFKEGSKNIFGLNSSKFEGGAGS
jgi:hypothetical protein